MYGLLIESMVETIKSKYGVAIWEQVKKKAKIDNQCFSTHQQYSETLIQRIVKHLSDATGIIRNKSSYFKMNLTKIDFRPKS